MCLYILRTQIYFQCHSGMWFDNSVLEQILDHRPLFAVAELSEGPQPRGLLYDIQEDLADFDRSNLRFIPVVLVMNACIFMPNIHLIHKRAKNIHDLNAYNKYSLGKLYRQSWYSVIINCRHYCR